MATQLPLLETTSRTWKLDRKTREIGRRGVAEARAALRGIPQPGPGEPHRPCRSAA